MNRIKLITGIIATSICCMGNEVPAKAHHVNPHIDQALGTYCIHEMGFAWCTCIEADIMRRGNGERCRTVRTTSRPQPPSLMDWVLTNPYKDSTLQAPRISF